MLHRCRQREKWSSPGAAGAWRSDVGADWPMWADTAHEGNRTADDRESPRCFVVSGARCSPTDALIVLELGHWWGHSVVVRHRSRLVAPVGRVSCAEAANARTGNGLGWYPREAGLRSVGAGGNYRRWFGRPADVAEKSPHRGCFGEGRSRHPASRGISTSLYVKAMRPVSPPRFGQSSRNVSNRRTSSIAQR